MSLAMLNKVCYTICIVCIIAGILLGLCMIWISYDSPYIWKSFLTIVVFFLGSALTLAVTKTFYGERPEFAPVKPARDELA